MAVHCGSVFFTNIAIWYFRKDCIFIAFPFPVALDAASSGMAPVANACVYVCVVGINAHASIAGVRIGSVVDSSLNRSATAGARVYSCCCVFRSLGPC